MAVGGGVLAGVTVGVDVGVDIGSGVLVGVTVGVFVGVDVGCGVLVGVAVGAGVWVAVGLDIEISATVGLVLPTSEGPPRRNIQPEVRQRVSRWRQAIVWRTSALLFALPFVSDSAQLHRVVRRDFPHWQSSGSHGIPNEMAACQQILRILSSSDPDDK